MIAALPRLTASQAGGSVCTRSSTALRSRAALLVVLVLATASVAASQDTPPAPAPSPSPGPTTAVPPSAPRAISRRPYASAKTHLAIERGLSWLARHQDDKGRWSGATCAKACEAVDPKAKGCQPETALAPRTYTSQADVGLTSLALLAF